MSKILKVKAPGVTQYFDLAQMVGIAYSKDATELVARDGFVYQLEAAVGEALAKEMDKDLFLTVEVKADPKPNFEEAAMKPKKAAKPSGKVGDGDGKPKPKPALKGVSPMKTSPPLNKPVPAKGVIPMPVTVKAQPVKVEVPAKPGPNPKRAAAEQGLSTPKAASTMR